MTQASMEHSGAGKPTSKRVKRDHVDCPFTVIYDTREQLPYKFTGFTDRSTGLPLRIYSTRATVHVGDYTIQNYTRVVVERKSKADLFSSMNSDDKRENFRKRLEALSDPSKYDHATVVVESEISGILYHPPEHTQLKPKSVIGSITAWRIQYPAVHWFFLPDRIHAEAWTFRYLEKAWKYEQERLKASSQTV